MKKFFKTLLIALFVIPCAFLFSACGKDDEPTYDRAANEANFDATMEVVADFGDNFTVTGTASTSGVFDSEQQASAQPSIPSSFGFKVDGSNIIVTDSGEDVAYIVNGIMYIPVDENQYTLADSMLPNFDEFDVSEDDMQAIKDYAFSTNAEAIKTNGNVVSITFDMAGYLNTVLATVSANREQPISTLIEAVIKNVTGATVEMDTVFDGLTEVTEGSIGDILTQIKTEYGVDLLPQVKLIYGLVSLSGDGETAPVWLESALSENIDYAYLPQFMPEMVDEIISAPISALLPEGFPGFATIKEMFNQVTLIDIVMSSVEEFETFEPGTPEYAAARVEVSNMIATGLSQIRFNALSFTAGFEVVDNEFTGLDLTFNLNLAVQGMPIVGAATISLDFSDIGETEVALPTFDAETRLGGAAAYFIETDLTDDVVISGIDSATFALIAGNDGMNVDGLVTITKASDGTYTITIAQELLEDLATQENTANAFNVIAMNETETAALNMMFFVQFVEAPTAE